MTNDVRATRFELKRRLSEPPDLFRRYQDQSARRVKTPIDKRRVTVKGGIAPRRALHPDTTGINPVAR
jgi:hypothetical protein